MKVSILLPYKENYSENYAGAVSIFVKGINDASKYKINTKIFGNTAFKNNLSKNYINIPFKKKFFFSSSKIYVKNFIKIEKRRKSEIIEIHNRPSYLKYFQELKDRKIVLYFHNDPLLMSGSSSANERILILKNCDKIIFNSNWIKKRFFEGIETFYKNTEKTIVIPQSSYQHKINLKKKQKLITFVGRLNKSKGYDIFGKAIIKVLDKYKDWKAYVIGDEPREKINFDHPRLFKMGYLPNNEVLEKLKKTSISVTCSTWNEPFGRSSLEASSCGCAVIISNRGGLQESITDGIILKELDSEHLFKNVVSLIKNKKKRLTLQRKSIENFYLTHKFVASLVDNYRNELFHNKIKLKKKIKILHITNFNTRHNGRLFYNTGRRINNGLLSLGHTVQSISDRDEISNNRKLFDLKGSNFLNNKIIDIVGNFVPDLILLGHADQISNLTLEKIKNFYPKIKISQWFLDRMDKNNWIVNSNRFKKNIKYMDASFCTTSPSHINVNSFKNVFFIPNPVDKNFENLKIFKKKNFNYDLFFAISHGVHRGILKKGKFDKRENFVKKLVNASNEIKFNIFGIDNKQPIWAEEFKYNLSQCKMALNLSQGHPIKFYSSDRLVQLMGNGIFTFIEYKTQLYKLFKSNKEVVFYKNHNDLCKKIIFYKNNNNLRNKVAYNGWKKYHKYFNTKNICDYMIKKSFNIKYNKKFLWENL